MLTDTQKNWIEKIKKDQSEFLLVPKDLLTKEFYSEIIPYVHLFLCHIPDEFITEDQLVFACERDHLAFLTIPERYLTMKIIQSVLMSQNSLRDKFSYVDRVKLCIENALVQENSYVPRRWKELTEEFTLKQPEDFTSDRYMSYETVAEIFAELTNMCIHLEQLSEKYTEIIQKNYDTLQNWAKRRSYSKGYELFEKPEYLIFANDTIMCTSTMQSNDILLDATLDTWIIRDTYPGRELYSQSASMIFDKIAETLEKRV